MKFSPAAIAAILSTTALGASLNKRDSAVPAFDYANDKVRGVNLGGWFVLEPYMNPSMFADFASDNIPVDEYHLTKQLGKEASTTVLQTHWDTWITEDDFAQLESWGFNFVRIPIGYWAFVARDEDPYIQGQIPYLDKALGWARDHNISAWIDLHGVPGSQNGFDNSGQRDVWDWQNTEYPQNQADTYRALDAIVERYAGSNYSDVVAGIELVNEPLGTILNMTELVDYYHTGYQTVRDTSSDQGVIIHDAFKTAKYFDDDFPTDTYNNVVVDHHHYQVFEVASLQQSMEDRIETVCQYGRDYEDNLWRVFGEWSAAMTDCTPLLNGVYRGARYDATYQNDAYIGSCEGINDISTWTDTKKANTRKYVEAQLDAYERGSGWIFWAYKTENAIEWDVRKLIEYGMFPQPLTDRTYPNQCGY